LYCICGRLSAPLTPIHSFSLGALAETLPQAPLLPLREKVAAKRSDEGCAAPPHPPTILLPVAIQRLFERPIPQPPIGRNKRLVLTFPPRDIRIHQPLDRAGHILGHKPRPQNLAHRRILASIPAHGDLVKLGALLLDTQNPDMAHMVMPAGI